MPSDRVPRDRNAALFDDRPQQTPEERLEAYRNLQSVLEKNAGLIEREKYTRFRPESLVKAVARLDELKAEEARDAARSESIPKKPVHEPPKYDGAFKLAGRVVTQYSDAAVIAQGKKYYAVLDASCRLVSCWMYVEPTGETRFIADIGRDGRDVEVVRITERETMTDDKRAHRAAVAEYEKEYRSAVQEYQDAVAQNRALVRELAANEKARAKEGQKILTEIDKLLRALLKTGKGGELVLVEELPDEGSSRPNPVEHKVKAAPSPQANSLASSTPAANPASSTPVVKPNRRDCLRTCIASCSGDANCERACAVGRCK